MFNNYPYTNFHELNLAYFLQQFEQIFQQWHELYTTLQEWKVTTTEELETWKAAQEAAMEAWESDLLADLAAWKSTTEDDISAWETATLSALDDWKDAFETLFDSTFSDISDIKTDAEDARDAAIAAQEAAEAAAASVSSSSAQITANAADIALLTDELFTNNSVDVLPFFSTYTDRTINGITFTYAADKKSCTANGTSTGVAYTELYPQASNLPDELKPGKNYYVKVYSTTNNLYLRIRFFAGSTEILVQSFIRDGILSVPASATNCDIRIYAVTNSSHTNSNISFSLLTADNNLELSENIITVHDNTRKGIVTILDNIDVIQGSFGRTGAVVENNARIRNTGFIRTYQGERINFTPGSAAAQMLIGYFESDFTYIADSPWFTDVGSVDLNDGYIICVFRKTDTTASITPAEYDAVTTITPSWLNHLEDNAGAMVPDYYFANSYLPNKVNSIKTIGLGLSRQSGRSVFISDYHAEANAGRSPALARYIVEHSGIKDVVFNGDYITSETTKLAGYTQLCEFINATNPIASISKVYYVTGNHEFNNPTINPDYVATREISDTALFALFNDPLENATCLDGSLSFYVDDDNAKIRYYYINCERGALIAVNTIKRVLRSAENIPEGYAVMIYSHVGLNSDNSEIDERFQYVMGGMAALNDGTTYSYDGQTFNYTDKARTVCGAITGHTHLEGYQIYDGRFPVIAVACDCYMAPQQSSHPERVAGSILEQSFEVMQLDVSAKRIYLTRIGWGSDRTFSFGTGAGPIT